MYQYNIQNCPNKIPIIFVTSPERCLIGNVYCHLVSECSTFRFTAQIGNKQGDPLHAAFFTEQIGFHDLLFVSELFYGMMIMQAVL